MSDVYFDTNVFDRISREGSAQAVREWLQDGRWRLRVSQGLMSEAFRITDASTRRERFEVITRLATVYPQPSAFLLVRELVTAVEALRPHWLRNNPDLPLVSRFLNLDRNTWRRLRDDPTYMPQGLEQHLSAMRDFAGDVRGRQRATRARLLASMQAPSEALAFESAEDNWRLTTALQTWSSLFPEEGQERYSSVHLAYLDPRRVQPPDLVSFFMREVAGDQLSMARVLGLTDYFQRRYEVTVGNWMDQGHALELLTSDLFVTRDETLHTVLSDVSGAVNTRARLILLGSAETVLGQLLRI